MSVRQTVSGILATAVVLAATPVSATPESSGEFSALTYNVAGLTQGISRSEPATNSPLISPLLNAYDLVLLQEDWEDVADLGLFYHDEIVSEANHPYRSEPAPHPMGTDFRRFPTGPPLISDGLNRLSRFPFDPLQRHMWKVCFGEFAVEAAETILSAVGAKEPIEDAGLGSVVDGGSADCGAQKGFAVARTRFGDVEIDVYNVHGDAGGGKRDSAARAAGFIQLADFIRAYSKDRAVILGGDTNLRTEPGSEGRAVDKAVWRKFQSATGLSDVCTVVDCKADVGIKDKFAFRNGRGVSVTPLSYRFERKRFTRDDGEPLSDHDPLAVLFLWRASGDGSDPRPVLPMTGGQGPATMVAGALLGLAALGLVLVGRREWSSAAVRRW